MVVMMIRGVLEFTEPGGGLSESKGQESLP